MSDNKKLRAAERVFRSLLKLFPFDFRSNYGRELEQVFREQRREAREGKGLAPIRLWSRTIRGVFSTALSEHFAIFGRDARYAVRTLLQPPTFTMAVVVTLMVGIGANTAIFSVVNGVLLRSLPYDEPERLVRVYETDDGTIDVGGYLTGLDFVDYRDSGIFDGLASFYDYQDTGFDLSGDGSPVRVSSLRISAGYFEVLRSKPLLGRTFESGDETAAPLTVLGEGLWRRHFGSAPDILGRQILLDAVPYTVIGVMPRSLKGPNGSDTDLWIPLNLQPGGSNSRGNHYLSAVGRLKPLAGLQGTQNEVNRLAARLAAENDGFNEGRSAGLVPLHDSLIAETRPMLYILLGAVGLVLLIGCANVANLFLARGSNRQRELAIRAALGSGRARLVRQLLTENIILAGIGGLGGLALAYVGVRLLLAIGPDTLPLTETVVFDRQVFAFVGVLSLATGFLFGLIPALQASRPNVNGFLAAGGQRLSSGRRQQRFRASFVLAQVALALILVVGAGLLIRSFNKLVDVDLGFETDQVLTFAINLPDGRYGQADQRTAFYRTYYEQINSLPGVESAGSVSKLPASGEYHIWGVQVVGREDGENEGYRAANIRCFDGEYFESLGITLLEGRLPDERDRSDSAMVIVVNSALSRTFFPDGNALGENLRPGGGPPRTIVGIVANTRHDHFEPLEPKVYVPHSQFADDRNWTLTQVVRSSLPPEVLLAAIGQTLTKIDPELVLHDVRTLGEVAATGIARQRFAMVLMGIFSAVALLLAATGIYGVIAYSVSQRLKEIGIRKVLGAQESNLWRWIMVEGLAPVAGGIGLGIVGAFWLARYLSSLVYEVSATDPTTMATSILALGAVAVAAGAYPAWSASRTDPNTVLRRE